MKTCYVCKESKSLDDFHKRKDTRDGRQTKCKECAKTVAKKWQADNAEKHEEYWRARDSDESTREERMLKKRARVYKLTLEELKELLASTGGLCEICQRPPQRWLVVDHCHSSLKVRGILCEHCNQALGLFRDDTVAIQRAIEYLQNSN